MTERAPHTQRNFLSRQSCIVNAKYSFQQIQILVLLPNNHLIPQEWHGWEEDCNVAMSYHLSVRRRGITDRAGALFTSLLRLFCVYGCCLRTDNGACREDVPWMRPPTATTGGDATDIHFSMSSRHLQGCQSLWSCCYILFSLVYIFLSLNVFVAQA